MSSFEERIKRIEQELSELNASFCCGGVKYTLFIAVVIIINCINIFCSTWIVSTILMNEHRVSDIWIIAQSAFGTFASIYATFLSISYVRRLMEIEDYWND